MILSLAETRDYSQLVQINKDRMLYAEGDPSSHWFTVVEGVIRTCRFDSDGQRQVTGFHFAGDVFGLDDIKRHESAEAVTDARVRRVARSNDPDMADFEPTLRRAILQARRTIAIFGRRTAPERVAAFIVAMAERLRVADRLGFPMSRTDIADYLGLTIHTISRTMTQLCSDGIIALDGPQHCRIRDWNQLRRLAGEPA